MIDPWETALTGNTLGPYRLERVLGRGGFGYVFEATNQETATPFALKVLSPSRGHDASAVIDFENECTLLKKLNPCSSVINLVDSGVENVLVTLGGGEVPLSLKYHVLALASGSLDELLVSPEQRLQLAWSERLRLWRGAVKGVHQMHLKSIAHRDIKSENCLLMVAGHRTEVRLADFGRSKDYTTPLRNSPEHYAEGRGDRRFAPPEHLLYQGGSTEDDYKSADLYGLGSLLVELTTGQPMTAIALGSWADVQRLGLDDLTAGVVRDLATLRPSFRSAIEAVSEEFPGSIRQDAAKLLAQLCDPVPIARMPQRYKGRRAYIESDMHWLLRRIDILSHRLKVADRKRSNISRITERSA